MKITIIKNYNNLKTVRVEFKNKTEFCKFLKGQHLENEDQKEVVDKIKKNKYVSLTDIYIAFANSYNITFGKIK